MLSLVATCALGLEEFLAAELRALGHEPRSERGAVAFAGDWADVWRANLWLRTANRVLVALGEWDAADGDALAHGARQLVESDEDWGGQTAATLFEPGRTLALHATSSHSQVTDTRWIALRVKDGVVDGQRHRTGRRSEIDRHDPDLPLRVWLHRDRATLLLDTSGDSLDHRRYRPPRVDAPLREQLAAACVLASGWDGTGPVVDPMCGSGTLLVEAGWIALGRPPGALRSRWQFTRLPGFDEAEWQRILAGSGAPASAAAAGAADRLRLHGVDRDVLAIAAARESVDRAGLADRAELRLGNAFELVPPPGPGLVVVNPPYGERLERGDDQWKRLGDLLKKRYQGYRAAIVAGGEGLGKSLGLRPRRRIPVRNGPLDARILVLDLY